MRRATFSGPTKKRGSGGELGEGGENTQDSSVVVGDVSFEGDVEVEDVTVLQKSTGKRASVIETCDGRKVRFNEKELADLVEVVLPNCPLLYASVGTVYEGEQVTKERQYKKWGEIAQEVSK